MSIEGRMDTALELALRARREIDKATEESDAIKQQAACVRAADLYRRAADRLDDRRRS